MPNWLHDSTDRLTESAVECYLWCENKVAVTIGYRSIQIEPSFKLDLTVELIRFALNLIRHWFIRKL